MALLRGLIGRVVARHGREGWEIEVQGKIAALVALGLATDNGQPTAIRARLDAGTLRQAKVVAGLGFEPSAFRSWA